MRLAILLLGLSVLAVADDQDKEVGQVRTIIASCDVVWSAGGAYYVAHSMYLVASDRAAGIMSLRMIGDDGRTAAELSISHSDEGRSCSVRVKVISSLSADVMKRATGETSLEKAAIQSARDVNKGLENVYLSGLDAAVAAKVRQRPASPTK